MLNVGKRILFDTGNNAEIFAHNVEAKGVDLKQLDFAVVSHRHGDHTAGLNYLLKVNPSVKIYAPQENFGVFGAALPGTFYRRNESLPADMRYFDGRPPETLRFGSPWPDGNFTWITKTTEIAPGLHLILLNGTWGVDLEVSFVRVQQVSNIRAWTWADNSAHASMVATETAASKLRGRLAALISRRGQRIEGRLEVDGNRDRVVDVALALPRLYADGMRGRDREIPRQIGLPPIMSESFAITFFWRL